MYTETVVTSPSPFADSPLVQDAYFWAQSVDSTEPPKEHYCETRDVLQARVDRLRNHLMRASMEDSDAALFYAILMEIGGNAFDHNLGNWPDVPGALLAWELGKKDSGGYCRQRTGCSHNAKTNPSINYK
jgi:hypothetical protein